MHNPSFLPSQKFDSDFDCFLVKCNIQSNLIHDMHDDIPLDSPYILDFPHHKAPDQIKIFKKIENHSRD